MKISTVAKVPSAGPGFRFNVWDSDMKETLPRHRRSIATSVCTAHLEPKKGIVEVGKAVRDEAAKDLPDKDDWLGWKWLETGIGWIEGKLEGLTGRRLLLWMSPLCDKLGCFAPERYGYHRAHWLLADSTGYLSVLENDKAELWTEKEWYPPLAIPEKEGSCVLMWLVDGPATTLEFPTIGTRLEIDRGDCVLFDVALPYSIVAGAPGGAEKCDQDEDGLDAKVMSLFLVTDIPMTEALHAKMGIEVSAWEEPEEDLEWSVNARSGELTVTGYTDVGGHGTRR